MRNTKHKQKNPFFPGIWMVAFLIINNTQLKTLICTRLITKADPGGRAV
jgi:hypothetical protein